MSANEEAHPAWYGRRAVVAMCSALLLAFVASCRGDHKPEQTIAANDKSQELPAMFATKLAHAAGASANGNTVKGGEHSLSLLTQVEQVETGPNGRMAAGVKVSCIIDGKTVDALTSGSVGSDSSRDAALATAAGEWAVQYGKPIVDALSAKAPAHQGGGYKVYAGPVGIRGSKPDGLEEMNANFFRAVEPSLATLISSKAGLHSLSVTAVRNNDGSIDGEFRVDGQVSETLKRLALQAKWPSSNGAYMLKQYYVLLGE
jgi:hypothetical protein